MRRGIRFVLGLAVCALAASAAAKPAPPSILAPAAARTPEQRARLDVGTAKIVSLPTDKDGLVAVESEGE